MLIYSLVDPRNDQLAYIGFTTKDPAQRLKAHLNDKGNTPKIDWLNKLKRLNLTPTIEKIEDVTKDNWQEREIYWISYFKEAGFKLKNYTNGGECGPTLKGSKQKLEHTIKSGINSRKTTPEQDEKIRKIYATGLKTQVEIGKEFGVGRETIMRIIHGRVNHYEEKPNTQKKFPGKRNLTFEDAEEIRRLYKTGNYIQAQLGIKYKIDKSVISDIVTNKSYKK